MPPWQQEVLMVLTAIGLQIAESRVRLGKAQSRAAWIIGITSVVLMVLAGVLAASGWAGGIVGWIAGLGDWVALALGIVGVIGGFLVVLVLLPQGIATDTTSTVTLVSAFAFPALWPYVVAVVTALWSVLPGAIGSLPGSFGA